MNKLLILDKDGTLVEPVSGKKFVQHPEDQRLLPGVAAAIARYASEGWSMAIASNQGGVAAGHKSLEQAIAEFEYCCKLTGIRRGMIAHSYEEEGGRALEIDLYSFHNPVEIKHPTRKFRKPNPGMIEYLASDGFPGLSWRSHVQVLFVGDRPEDQVAAQAAGVEFMWAEDWRKIGRSPG